MTYKLAFNESALKEWKKLGHTIQEQFKKKLRERLENPRVPASQVGSHTDGTPEPDFQKQVRLAFENLKATLTAAGCTFDDIVDVTTFHTDPEQQLNDVMAVKQEIFAHPPYPNWTAVGVTWLAGFDFEIKVIARIP
ncbi:RidA family protein [Salmonella enterica subsp. enterica]|nr:RidA family protein [Salmonella enterica subsp. enterica serovar Sandiego]EBT2240381.1 RidA family protein [Salmonella enterica]ECE7923565.1 RidA family protein [Salmonella enterica subsp. enterica serovar Sandiego]ECG2681050.1 RidA family protein [Salmonella enterica subsp. enterica serovar Sandiego]